MIIPNVDVDEINIYRCPICKNYYRSQTGSVQMQCCVLHAPGTCCHFGETLITGKKLKTIKGVLDE